MELLLRPKELVGLCARREPVLLWYLVLVQTLLEPRVLPQCPHFSKKVAKWDQA